MKYLKLLMLHILCMCVLVVSYGYAQVIKINEQTYDLANQPYITTDREGNLYVAYYGKDGALYIKKNEEKAVKVSVNNGSGTFIEMLFFDKEMVLIWRPKLLTAEKYIYIQRSIDGGKSFSEPVIINNASHALPPIRVGSDGKDSLYVAWVDERKGYNVYLNYSHDRGKSFLKRDINLSQGLSLGLLPAIYVEGERVDVFFLSEVTATKDVVGAKQDDSDRKILDKRMDKRRQTEKEGKPSVYHICSVDRGRSWTEPIKIKEFEDWTPTFLQAVKSKDNLIVFWAGTKGINGASSKDGKIWTNLSLKDAIDVDVSRFNVVTDIRGSIYITAAWKKWGTHYTVKQNVYFLRSDDGGNVWTEAQRVNKNQYDVTTAYLPAMHIKDDGTLVVVWQDHRNIRGNIYLSYSTDAGRTWLQQEINLEDESGKYNSFYPYISAVDDKYYILWTRYADDRMFEEADIYMTTFSIDTTKEKKLKDRVMELWGLMVKRDRDKIYDYYDPFFRAKMSRANFMAVQSPVYHSDPEFVGAFVRGNVATVKVKVNYEVKDFMVRGRKIEQPKKNTVVTESWIYIDGNWHREYIDQIMDSTLSPY